MDSGKSKALQQLPGVDTLLSSAKGLALQEFYPRSAVVHAIRHKLDQLRQAILEGKSNGAPIADEQFWNDVNLQLERRGRQSLRPLINATGIVIHTNLGRAPLAQDAIDAIAGVARGYSNLELDLNPGSRGSRYTHVETLLQELTGAEAAVVVNNNAAAVLLVLNTLAKDREVIVSRGELVEIGGQFRMPDVVASSGARLVEVGATNKTRVSDYETAITENTRVLLKVHPSNFRIVGFTATASRGELAKLGKSHGIATVEDVGSGALVDLQGFGLPHEPTVQEVLEAGVDVVTCSGDKLLGGPQAGIIAGRAPIIDAIKKNPLIRALRIDKLSLAALEATLRLYAQPESRFERVPLMKMLAQSEEDLRDRARRIANHLVEITGVTVAVQTGESFAGGGALPEEALPTSLVVLSVDNFSAQQLQSRLRANEPPIIARIANDHVVLDPRTLFEEEEAAVVSAVQRIVL